MTKHTPGPWAAFDTAVVAPAYEMPVARVSNGIRGNPWTREARTANARLIAAAPELLEALEYYAADTSINGEVARAAIDKATGQN